jgi:hypothetical protein
VRCCGFQGYDILGGLRQALVNYYTAVDIKFVS